MRGGPAFTPLPTKSNELLLVGGQKKPVGKTSARRRPGQLRVNAFDNFGTMLSQSQNQFVKRFTGFGRDFDSGETLIGPLFSDLDLANLKIRAVRQDLIQHLRQNERINNVTSQLDRFRKHRSYLYDQID